MHDLRDSILNVDRNVADLQLHTTEQLQNKKEFFIVLNFGIIRPLREEKAAKNPKHPILVKKEIIELRLLQI